jgi:hypothetical protein
MLDHMRRFVKRLLKWAETTLPQAKIASNLRVFQSLRLTHRYLRHLSQRPPVQSASPPKPRSGKNIPKKIWFISDLQWEQKEMIPELKKIGEVRVTNLNCVTGRNVCREEVFQYVESNSKEESPDLIVLYAREGLLSEPLFALLRKKNVPIWGINMDDKTEFFQDEHRPYEGRYGYCRWAKFFDLNLTSVLAMVDQYRLIGAEVRYFPEGYYFRPEFLDNRPPLQHELSFVGASREDRREIIEAIQRYGYRPDLFGNGWHDEKIEEFPWKTYRSSQISLGIGFSTPSRATSLKTRDFECPGSQACYLTTYNWEICEHFEMGKEVLCYRSPDELVEMLSYFLPRPELCAKIALAGYNRAKADHTWEKRFRTVFEQEF